MRFRRAILSIEIRIITICRSILIRTDPFRSWKIGLSSFESKHFDIFWWILGGSFAYCFQSSSIFEFWNETLVKKFLFEKKVIFSYSKDYLEKNQTKSSLILPIRHFGNKYWTKFHCSLVLIFLFSVENDIFGDSQMKFFVRQYCQN